MSYRVGFDVGGTFTDFVLQSPAGDLTTGKRLTTYPDPSEACLAGLDALLARAGVAWADVGQAVHGTTLGSNVVIERKARGVGLLTTRGFRDVLVIGREKRYQVYDLQIEKPPPLVPRRLIGEVTERVLADGSVRTPLDEADARRAIRELVARGVTTLAVCLLHAYLNPAHEQRIAALAAEEAPDLIVTLSHEVSPTFREYERTSTTVVNAYVMTAVRDYLRGLGRALGARIVHVYGLTETYGPHTVCQWQPDWAGEDAATRARLLSRQGVAMVMADPIRVVDEAGRDVPRDGATVGEIVMRGNNVMKGYHDDPDATAHAFRGGVFHSGDLGVQHPDGYVELRDRAKDVVISGGENISTIEVEQAIVSHRAVLEAAVVGIPDERWGERPKAFVVLRPGAAAGHDELTEHVRARLAHYKCPDVFQIVDELPRTSTGKVRKVLLREREWAGHERMIS